MAAVYQFTMKICSYISKTLNQHILFHRAQWITSISSPIHIYTSGVPIKSKGIQLESSEQYWRTLKKL